MNVFVGIMLFLGGMMLGGLLVFSFEKKEIDNLIGQCRDANNQLDKMIEEEKTHIESAWLKRQPVIMTGSVADYLRDKYLAEEVDDAECCEEGSA